MFTIDTSEVTRGMQQFSKAFEAELEVAVENTLKWIEVAAKQIAPVESGYLRDNIKAGVVNYSGKILSGEVVSGAEYSLWVEVGSAFRRSHPFFRPVLKRAEKVLIHEVKAAFNRVRK